MGDSNVRLCKVFFLALLPNQDNVTSHRRIGRVPRGKHRGNGPINVFDEVMVKAFPEATCLNVPGPYLEMRISLVFLPFQSIITTLPRR